MSSASFILALKLFAIVHLGIVCYDAFIDEGDRTIADDIREDARDISCILGISKCTVKLEF